MFRVIYGNGDVTAGEYIAPKEIASVAIVQLPGGVKVDWGGDIEILTGDSWYMTSQTKQGLSGQYRLDRMPYVSQSGALWGWINANFIGNFVPSWRVLNNSNNYKTSQLYANSFAFSTCESSSALARKIAQTPAWFGIRNEQRNAVIPQSVTDPITGRVWVQNAPVPFDAIVGICGSSKSTSTSYTVTTSTGQTATRQTSSPPTVSLLSGGCAVSIAYTDASTEQIPLSECYEWVEIVIDCPQWVCDTLDNLINLVGNF